MGDYKQDPNNPNKQVPNTAAYRGGDGTAVVRKYATVGDLPTSAGVGAMALVGTDKLYVYHGTAWVSVTLS